MTIVNIATTNQAKIVAVKEAFEIYFEDVQVESFEANSGVPSQPTGDNVIIGAENRVRDMKCKKHSCKDADFLVGIEGGIVSFGNHWFNTQFVYIEDSKGRQSYGFSQGFPIPSKYIIEVKSSSVAKTLDRVFENQGGVRKLTHGLETRSDLIKEGTIMALTGIINGDKW